MKRIAHSGFGLLLSLGLLAVPAGAQSSTQSNSPSQATPGSSLGDYARQVRKDTQPKAKPKVFDNDNLPREDKLSVVGTAPPPSSVAENSDAAKPAENSGDASRTPAAGDSKAAPAAPAKSPEEETAARQAEWKQWQQQITSQKDSIELLKREADVLQREYQVRAAAFYADAGNRLRNSGSWDKEDARYKEQIAAKQKSLDDATQKLEETEEKARKAGVPANMREPE